MSATFADIECGTTKKLSNRHSTVTCVRLKDHTPPHRGFRKSGRLVSWVDRIVHEPLRRVK